MKLKLNNWCKRSKSNKRNQGRKYRRNKIKVAAEAKAKAGAEVVENEVTIKERIEGEIIKKEIVLLLVVEVILPPIRIIK